MSTVQKIQAKGEELRQLRIQETIEELNQVVIVLNMQMDKVNMLNERLHHLQKEASK